MYVTNAAQIREIDHIMVTEFAYPALLLMETAGRKAASWILTHYPMHDFVILCGPGNNGGDGLVIARYLANAGRTVKLILSYNPADLSEGIVQQNFQIIEKMGMQYSQFPLEGGITLLQEAITHHTVVIDALQGTGLRGKLQGTTAALLNAANTLDLKVIAIDMPSGLLGDTGALVNTPLRCVATLTFELPKICHYVTPAASYCGEVVVVDIDIYDFIADRLGIKTQLVTPAMIRQWYQPRSNPDVHKGKFGHVLAVGGSRQKAGAIALAAHAVMEVGTGLCTAYIPGGANCAFHYATLECMTIPYGAESVMCLNETAGQVLGTYLADKTVVLVGPGLEHNTDTLAFLRHALPQIATPMVLDADALNILAAEPSLWDLIPPKVLAETVITPHPGEMGRLMGIKTEEVQAKRYESAINYARERKVTVILKGAHTIVATPNGTMYLSKFANPGMSTAGTGDVLAGAVAGLLAQGYKAAHAAAMAVYIHAHAGEALTQEYGHEGLTASKLSNYLGKSLHQTLSTPLSAERV